MKWQGGKEFDAIDLRDIFVWRKFSFLISHAAETKLMRHGNTFFSKVQHSALINWTWWKEVLQLRIGGQWRSASIAVGQSDSGESANYLFKSAPMANGMNNVADLLDVIEHPLVLATKKDCSQSCGPAPTDDVNQRISVEVEDGGCCEKDAEI